MSHLQLVIIQFASWLALRDNIITIFQTFPLLEKKKHYSSTAALHFVQQKIELPAWKCKNHFKYQTEKQSNISSEWYTV